MEVESSTAALISASTLPAEPTNDSVPASAIDSTFSASCIDLVSASLSSQILSLSDEFFAEAANLLTPTAPIHRPGYYVPTGAWYDGWETRRHNRAPFDWVVIRLGVASGIVQGVEVDTAFFDGNHAPDISVQGCLRTSDEGGKADPAGREADDAAWTKDVDWRGWHELLGKRECGPSQRHAWLLPPERQKRVSHVRLCMWPDGGIARFRLYGRAVVVWPADPGAEVELSAATMGGVAVSCSDQHFGRRENLLLPGRGKDMGDGWETKRSRGEGHTDWAVVKLGGRGRVGRVVVDTMHFRGNFPRGVRVLGLDAEGQEGVVEGGDGRWRELVVGEREVGADNEAAFGGEEELCGEEGRVCTHVKLVMVPDGGVKRLRVFGRRV